MKKKLLLADDSITIQKVIAITFSSDDYALTVVDNGIAAIEKAQTDRPDLIMADVFMPGKNGYEVCAAVKSNPNLQGVPVLLLTGTFEPFDEAKALQVGADKWIAKPFESQKLIDNVEELLAKAAQQPTPVPAAAATTPATAAVPSRPLPGAPIPPQPAAAAPSPATTPLRPIPGTPVPPVVPPAATAAPEPGPAPIQEEDIWGGSDDLSASFGELSGPDEFAPQESLTPADADEDLWGSVAFEEPPPLSTPAAVETTGEDDWGSITFDEPPPVSVSAPIAPDAADAWGMEDQDFAVEAGAGAFGAAEIPLSDTSVWGEIEEDLTSPQPEPLAPLAPGGWEATDELAPLEDVEILEEVELGEPDEFASEPAMADAGSLELSGFDAMGESEILWEEPLAAAPLPGVAWEEEPAAESQAEITPEPESELFTEDAFAGAAEAPLAPRRAAEAVEERVTALSEAELARIVENVSGAVIERLASSILEKIAWEVVPELAEVLIKAELSKIRDEVESSR